jgi:hypothetical protein
MLRPKIIMRSFLYNCSVLMLIVSWSILLTACNGIYERSDSKEDSASTEMLLPGKSINLLSEILEDEKQVEEYKDYLKFVPENYSVLFKGSGDLNEDNYPDVILVLKRNGEDSTSDVVSLPEKRPLLILTGTARETYQLAASSNNAVYCVDCGGVMGDPFTGVTVKNGYFSVEHYGGSAWRWSRIITFKYDANEKTWYLHKDGGESYHVTEQEKGESKIRTVKDFGKVKFEAFDIYKDVE